MTTIGRVMRSRRPLAGRRKSRGTMNRTMTCHSRPILHDDIPDPTLGCMALRNAMQLFDGWQTIERRHSVFVFLTHSIA